MRGCGGWGLGVSLEKIGMTSKWTDAVDRDEGMDDQNYHIREVYASFGLDSYHAQVLNMESLTCSPSRNSSQTARLSAASEDAELVQGSRRSDDDVQGESGWFVGAVTVPTLWSGSGRG